MLKSPIQPFNDVWQRRSTHISCSVMATLQLAQTLKAAHASLATRRVPAIGSTATHAAAPLRTTVSAIPLA